MLTIEHREDETHEFKERWTDEALKDLTAFANGRGGTLFVGVRDDGMITGAPAHDAEIQRIANVITSRLGLTPSIRVTESDSHTIIVVEVEPNRGTVSYQGRYLRRVGSTNRDFTMEELARHLLERSGRTWDSLPSIWTPDQVDPEALAYFARLARPRLPHVDAANAEQLLRNLNLIKEDRLTNAGVLLFGQRPQQLFATAQLRIGLFRSIIHILDSHDFTGTLWQQLDGAMERFRQVLKVRFDIRVTELTVEGLQRQDVWEYPLDALREVVINALIHRDYTIPADIQIRLYEDRLEAWNVGDLLPPLTPEQLRGPHSSVLRNPLIAQAFYFAGMIERWGTGTTRVIALCREQDMPEPIFETGQGGMRVTFAKDPYTPERLRVIGLNDRQIQAVRYAKEHGSISNREYRQLNGVSDEGARLDLKQLMEMGVFAQQGKGRSVVYGLAAIGD
jgi:ATP-dependent DNA helicase RecG